MDSKRLRRRIIVLTMWCFVLSVIVAAETIAIIIIGKKLYRESEGWGRTIRTEEIAEPEFGESPFPDMVLDNYLKYLDEAYLLFGTYPDCDYYKISDKIARNEYDFINDFEFVNSGTSEFLYYMQDGKKASSVAIDVSEYQGDIDWKKVKEAGVTTAIVRAGFRGYGAEGKLSADAMYTSHVDAAKKAGVKTAAYFFTEAVNYDEGVEEAQYALSLIKGHEPSEKIIIIDTELIYNDDEARANNISNEDRTQAIKGFCETIKAAGYTPMIYASYSWFLWNMDLDQLADYELWLADYEGKEYMNFPYVMAGWQYSPYGSVPGVSGEVDVNVWFK